MTTRVRNDIDFIFFILRPLSLSPSLVLYTPSFLRPMIEVPCIILCTMRSYSDSLFPLWIFFFFLCNFPPDIHLIINDRLRHIHRPDKKTKEGGKKTTGSLTVRTENSNNIY